MYISLRQGYTLFPAHCAKSGKICILLFLSMFEDAKSIFTIDGR